MTTEKLTRCRVYLDGVGVFHGYTTGERWNGFACPQFEREEVERLFATGGLRASDGSVCRTSLDSDVALVWTDLDEEPEVYHATTLDTVDGPRVLYAVGAWGWCWMDWTDEDRARVLAGMLAGDADDARYMGALACAEEVAHRVSGGDREAAAAWTVPALHAVETGDVPVQSALCDLLDGGDHTAWAPHDAADYTERAAALVGGAL